MYLSCPSCNAPADNVCRFSAMAICPYCNMAYKIDGNSTVTIGYMAIDEKKSEKIHSTLITGNTGLLEDRKFLIAGRIRFSGADGFMDQWCLVYEDSNEIVWLSEADGELSLKEETVQQNLVPHYDQLHCGDQLEVAGKIVAVSQKTSKIFYGAEGEIPFVIEKDTKIDFIHATFGDKEIVIEYSDNDSNDVKVYELRFIDSLEINFDQLLPFDDL